MTDGQLALMICCHHDVMMRTTTIQAHPNYICNTTISLLIKKETSIEVVRIIKNRKNSNEREEPSSSTVRNKCTTTSHATTNRVRYHNDNTQQHTISPLTHLPTVGEARWKTAPVCRQVSIDVSIDTIDGVFDDCGVTLQRTSEL